MIVNYTELTEKRFVMLYQIMIFFTIINHKFSPHYSKKLVKN